MQHQSSGQLPQQHYGGGTQSQQQPPQHYGGGAQSQQQPPMSNASFHFNPNQPPFVPQYVAPHMYQPMPFMQAAPPFYMPGMPMPNPMMRPYYPWPYQQHMPTMPGYNPLYPQDQPMRMQPQTNERYNNTWLDQDVVPSEQLAIEQAVIPSAIMHDQAMQCARLPPSNLDPQAPSNCLLQQTMQAHGHDGNAAQHCFGGSRGGMTKGNGSMPGAPIGKEPMFGPPSERGGGYSRGHRGSGGYSRGGRYQNVTRQPRAYSRNSQQAVEDEGTGTVPPTQAANRAKSAKSTDANGTPVETVEQKQVEADGKDSKPPTPPRSDSEKVKKPQRTRARDTTLTFARVARLSK